MRDLIRNYKMITKRRESTDSGAESHPLLSSESSVASFGAIQDQCMFHDSDTTDYEAEKFQNKTLKTEVSPKHSFMQRPFCFPGRYEAPSIDIFAHEEKVYERFSYFSKINGVLNMSTSSLIRKNLDYEDSDDIESPKTHSSLVTIFAIWNTIMGSSLLAMPWGMEKAGLFPGVFLNILVAGICLYTCYLLLRVNEDHGLIGQNNEVSDLCRMLLGRWAEITAKIFSLVVLIGALIVYWVLMSNFLYHSVHFLYGYILSVDDFPIKNDTVICPKELSLLNITTLNSDLTNIPTWEKQIPTWSFDQFWDLYSTVPILLAVFMFPLLNFKSATFFTKFNSIGTLSVLYLLAFVAFKSYSWGINMDDWKIEFNLKPTFCALSGMLSLSYFIHNIIINIMRNNRYQENNGRDLSVAFGLVTFTYLFIGFAFYISFPLAKSCLEDNILNNFEKYDTLTIIARLLLLFQLVTVFPLISYMLRMDIFNNLAMLYKNWSYEFSYIKVVIVNLIIVTVCILFACFLPRIGTLIRYTGAISGLVYIFMLPIFLKIASLRKERRLSALKCMFFIIIPIFGFLNLFSQFFINDN
ncbi:hypothetical protein ILUMI_04489 [Ignelater luminosus]|uniref:Amino acid transporter transmembrane domain-containing protein n=1 Tax=Ignelater luminosus TaxID=2038154 RepID=A0A8K0DCH6_IGNLU|nr:hypothetical protein ILUMI_04489 [Ignelater luminosus]